MTAESPNHGAWLAVFGGLAELESDEIQRVLGVSMLTAGRLHTEAQDYVVLHNRALAENALLRTQRPKTLPKFLPKDEAASE